MGCLGVQKLIRLHIYCTYIHTRWQAENFISIDFLGRLPCICTYMNCPRCAISDQLSCLHTNRLFQLSPMTCCWARPSVCGSAFIPVELCMNIRLYTVHARCTIPPCRSVCARASISGGRNKSGILCPVSPTFGCHVDVFVELRLYGVGLNRQRICTDSRIITAPVGCTPLIYPAVDIIVQLMGLFSVQARDLITILSLSGL